MSKVKSRFNSWYKSAAFFPDCFAVLLGLAWFALSTSCASHDPLKQNASVTASEGGVPTSASLSVNGSGTGTNQNGGGPNGTNGTNGLPGTSGSGPGGVGGNPGIPNSSIPGSSTNGTNGGIPGSNGAILAIRFVPSTLTLPPIPVGSSEGSTCVYLENVGTEAAFLTSLAPSSGADFELGPPGTCPYYCEPGATVLPVGQACEVSVIYNASAVGIARGTFQATVYPAQ